MREISSGRNEIIHKLKNSPLVLSSGKRYKKTMSNFLTACLTIFGGIFVFVCGQIFIKFFLEPTQNLRKLLGEIAYSLDFYANQIYGNHPKTAEAKEIYRKQACQLREFSHLIFCYKLVSHCFRILPPKRNLEKASLFLMGLSNQCGHEAEGIERSSEIKQLLRIRSI